MTNGNPSQMGSRRQLGYSDYTIAWISALTCEFAAAQAVLEEIHEDLATPLNDDNIYSYGSIASHNIVIACLPIGVFGTTSAAVVATQLLATFPDIEVSLMVGIGGGVPGPDHDIRLGDVVVSVSTSDCPAAVVQYDFGKTVQSGRLESKGHLNKPKRRLLQAVSKLRANHDLRQSAIPAIIAEALRNEVLRNTGYGHPGSEKDTLFSSGCEHVRESADCPICGPLRAILRPSRPDNHPRIHHGPIASGNQVMKNSRIRDEIARPLGLICFEMEAAGLMDDMQCLVIRGISDYCDARKDKSFQKYASLTAAAYSRELLSIIPLSDSRLPHHISLSKQEQEQGRLRSIVQSLRFEEYGFRMAAIKAAHAETCEWLTSYPIYCTWLDDRKFNIHHGLLWIKAKPGAGKSTAMKFALQSMADSVTTISFFFNARGSDLERSASGMYRSLLLQLLEKLPRLQKFLNLEILPIKSSLWNLELLQNTFVTIVRSAGRTPITCFVDALDEGYEDDIREMLEIFSNLGELSAKNKTQFRVCFASRYYPHVSLPVGLEIRLDEAEEHMKDIKLYVDAEVPKVPHRAMMEIKKLLLSRSAGVFLWVVLVVRILKKEHDHGRIEKMQQKLMVLPSKLHDLFHDIILRDNENLDELLVCLQWLLYAPVPLSVLELFFGMQASKSSSIVSAWDPGSYSLPDMIRYIVSSSKGLMEIIDYEDAHDLQRWRNGAYIGVQFIHESVRDFLMDESHMIGLWQGFQDLKEGLSHEALSLCCFRYFSTNASITKQYILAEAEASSFYCMAVRNKYPLLRYVSRFSSFHAEMACKYGRPQLNLLQSTVLPEYLKLGMITTDDLHKPDQLLWNEEASKRAEPSNSTFESIKGMPGSMILLGSEEAESDLINMLIRQDLLHLALLQARHEKGGLQSISHHALSQLLLVAARIDESDFVESVLSTFPQVLNPDINLLTTAAKSGSINVVRLLLSYGVDVNSLDNSGRSALQYAAQYGNGLIVEALLDSGAVSNPPSISSSCLGTNGNSTVTL